MVEKGRARRPAHLAPDRPAHARRHPVVGDGPELRRQPDHPGRRSSTPTRSGGSSRRERVNSVMITGDAMGKPLIEALDEPGRSYDLSSLIGLTSIGRPVLGAGQGRVLPPLPQPGHRPTPSARRSRATTASSTMSQGRHGHEERTHGHVARRDRRLRRGPGSGRARFGRDRQDRPVRGHPRRLLQRPGQDGRGLHQRSTAPAT